jgi:hypothetical protein
MTYHADEGTSGYLPPLTGALELRATFVFPRPKSHFGTGRNAGKLKPSAPALVTTRPDLDKLVRAIGDALTGVVFSDDAHLAVVHAEKHYGSPCAHLVVSDLAALSRRESWAHVDLTLQIPRGAIVAPRILRRAKGSPT